MPEKSVWIYWITRTQHPMKNNKKSYTDIYRYTDKIAGKIIRLIAPDIGELLSFKNGAIGILDRQTSNFVLFQSQISPWHSSFPGPSFREQPSLSFFYQQMRPSDRQFVDNSIARVLEFLEKLSPEAYPNYRLTLDLCLQIKPRKHLRVMCHVLFLPPLKGLKSNYCILKFHILSFNTFYTSPLRYFRQSDSMKQELFKKGEGSMPVFTDLRRKILELVAEGKVVKEVADILGCAKRSVDNNLSDWRGPLHLSNNPHLVHYGRCFECI